MHAFFSRLMAKNDRPFLSEQAEYAHQINNHLQQCLEQQFKGNKKKYTDILLEISFNLRERKY